MLSKIAAEQKDNGGPSRQRRPKSKAKSSHWTRRNTKKPIEKTPTYKVIDIADHDLDHSDKNRLWVLVMWDTFHHYRVENEDDPEFGKIKRVPDSSWEPVELMENYMVMFLNYLERVVKIKKIPHPAITPELIKAEREDWKYDEEMRASGRHHHPNYGYFPKEIIGYRMPTEEECIEEEHLPEEEEVIGDILPTEEKAEFFYYVRWIDNHLGLAPRSYLTKPSVLAEIVNMYLDLIYQGVLTGMEEKIHGGCWEFRKKNKSRMASEIHGATRRHFKTIVDYQTGADYYTCPCQKPNHHLCERLGQLKAQEYNKKRANKNS